MSDSILKDAPAVTAEDLVTARKIRDQFFAIGCDLKEFFGEEEGDQLLALANAASRYRIKGVKRDSLPTFLQLARHISSKGAHGLVQAFGGLVPKAEVQPLLDDMHEDRGERMFI